MYYLPIKEMVRVIVECVCRLLIYGRLLQMVSE